jgi:hypothetical protein
MPTIKKKKRTPTTLNNVNGKFILPITVNTDSDGKIIVKLRTNSSKYVFKKSNSKELTFEKDFFPDLKAFISTDLVVPFELVGSGGGYCNLYFNHIDPDGQKESEEGIIILKLD